MLIQAFGFVRSAIGTLKMLPKGINNYHQPHNSIKFLNSFKLIKKTNCFDRFSIKVRVMDDTDSATFVIFDCDATMLFNKTCAEVLEAHDVVCYTLCSKSVIFAC
jgi:hypothetical protein